MRRVLILGATSAIGGQAARRFAADGVHLCLVARNPALLDAVAADLRVRGARVDAIVADLDDVASHAALIANVFERTGGIDDVLITYGVLPDQVECDRDTRLLLASFATNAVSVISLLSLLAGYFERERRGCIAVVASVAGDRGRRPNYAYGSAKGAVALFMQGLRGRLHNSGVRVVTIKPGFVDTPMTAHLRKNALYSSAETVGAGVYRAMSGRRDVVYVPGYWRWIMLIIKLIPEAIFKRLNI